MNGRVPLLCALAASGCATRGGERTLRPELLEAAARVTTQSQDRRGDLDLSCNPADAQIWVDGIQRGVCSDFGSARMLVLGQGMHSVEVKKQGFQTFQTYVDPDGIRARLNVALHPNPGRESGAEP